MREILFRGKHIHILPQNEQLDGMWVYGYLSDENYINTIEENEYGGKYTSESLVDSETICQYIGLIDKNGRKIFEGDIIKCGGNLVVTWNDKFAGWCLTKEGWLYNHFFGEACESKDCEVIGNIFDNPELMACGQDISEGTV